MPRDLRAKRSLWIGFVSAALLLVEACTRPQSMLVREAGDPIHADEDVAFRTTYYFRVFDYCAIRDRLDGNTVSVPLNDTLYRFVMTGKSSTLFANIRFESGTLSAQEIEPFGSTVEYDKELGRFRFQSRQDVETEAKRERALRSYDRLLALYDQITGPKPEDDTVLNGLRTEMVEALKSFIAEFRQASGSSPGPRLRQIAEGQITATQLSVVEEDGKFTIPFSVRGPQPAPQNFTLVLETQEDKTLKATLREERGAAVATLDTSRPIDCLRDRIPDRRGFQILGPEGWRTFDQDERLLMVMSTDAQPLIGTLKELSQRLIQSRAPTLAFQRVLPVERLRVANTKQSLDSPAPDPSPEAILDPAIETFNTEAGG